MHENSFQTAHLLELRSRLQAGERSAQEELLRHLCERLERLTRKMLRGFPKVRQHVETGDVLQGATLRLLAALRDVRPDSVRALFGLAAQQVRRELLDLARRLYGPHGLGTNQVGTDRNGDARLGSGSPDTAASPADLAEWTEFHELIARLPDEEREVMDLLFYHGFAQEEAAELLGVSQRTVQRRWRAALLRLHDALDGWPSA